MACDQEEALREAACIGNLEELEALLKLGVDVNSTNKVNGWTALHWAAKRGHIQALQKLLENGADKTAPNSQGQMAADLTANEKIRSLLGAPPLETGSSVTNESTVKFKPNYLANPEFLYSKAKHNDTSTLQPVKNAFHQEGGFLFRPQSVICTKGNQWSPCGLVVHPEFIVLCVRLANLTKSNSDFTEVEISRQHAPSLAELTRILCESLGLGIRPKHINKIRKLPNSVLRTDRDVLRLTDYQTLEIVLQPQAVHPLDGAVLSSEGASLEPDTRYLKEYVSKLIY